MSINEMFAPAQTTSAPSRGLQGTAELTNVASGVAATVLKAMETDIETFRPRIQKSTADSKELDAIIDELGNLSEAVEKVAFLSELNTDTVDNILRSQQSKRSRAKGKQMTMDNYRTLLTAAIAENLLRMHLGKPKNHSIGHSKGRTDYTIAELEVLAKDQVALKKEIRNVQSKKSIMKSKEGFSEADERWQKLLKMEQQLKDLRDNTATDSIRDDLHDMVGDLDVYKLNAHDAKDLISKIQKLLHPVAAEVVSEPTEDSDPEALEDMGTMTEI